MNTSTTTTVSTSQRSLNRLIILPLLYLLTCTFPATMTAAPTLQPDLQTASDLRVAVNGPLTVERGGQSVIYTHQLINVTSSISSAAAPATTTACIITHLTDAGDPCGSVWPVTTTCGNHTTNPTYTHYGCHNKYETLYLRLIISSSSNVTYVADLSLPVHIVPPSDLRHGYHFRLEVSTPTAMDGSNSSMDYGDTALTVHCPNQYVGHCWYAISPPPTTSSHDSSRLIKTAPHTYGRPIPCGQSPKQPILYHQTNTTLNTTAAIAIQSGCHDSAMPGSYYRRHTVLLVDLAYYHEPLKLPDSYLIITELATTPLSIDSLTAIGGSFHVKYTDLKLTFPVLPIGGLYPSYTSKQSGFLDTTVFTYSDLRQGRVSFVPDEASVAAYIPTKSQFHYYVSDIDTGQVIAKGTLDVTVSPRLGLRPSIRRNVGFSLFTNETAEINQDHLNFYPPLECLNYVMNITKLPLWGDLYYSDCTRPLEVSDQLNISEGNLSLVYTHNGHEGSSYDTISTTITCHGSQPFNVTIPVRIIHSFDPPSVTPLMYNCSLTLYGYHGHAVPLMSASAVGTSPHCDALMTVSGNNVLSVSITSHDSLTNLVFVDENCNISHFHSYPYINQSDYGWEECFSKVTIQQLDSQWARLWYLVPQDNSHSNPNTLLVSYDNGISLLVKYTIHTLSSTPRNDFEQIMDSGKHNHTRRLHTPTYYPYLRHNIALPLHTSDSTLITNHFLYVQSLGYLQSGIVFVILTPPKHGLLCLLQYSTSCSESVRNFTQEDILSERLYYKPPDAESVPDNEHTDLFEFEVYYMNDIKLNGPNKFEMHLMYLQHKDIKFNQFWIKSGKSRLLLRKYLKHLKHAATPLHQHKFTLRRQPSLGYIDRTEFTWQDVINRSVSYHHNADHSGCSDQILLTVEANGEIYDANISVAIQTQSSSIGGARQHKLDEGDSFTLSLNDLPISTGFCPEFIQVSIEQPLNYGLLIIQDPTHHTKRLLNTDAHFLASDIMEGHISYQIQPGITIIDDVQDDLMFGLSGPRGVIRESSVAKRDTVTPNDQSSTDVFHLLILIVPIEGSGLAFDFNLTSTVSKQVIKLSDNLVGAVLDSQDLYLNDPDLLPSEVHFMIHEQPQFGQLLKNNYPIEDFTLADINSGNITYVSTLVHDVADIIQDEFRYSIFIDLFDTHRRITLDNIFRFNWCYFTIDLSSNSEYITTEEVQPTTYFTIRKVGTNSYDKSSSVNVITTSANNHTIGINCTEQPSSYVANMESTILHHPDYCLLNQKLQFVGKSSKHRVPLSILDDHIPEGLQEAINIDLTQPIGCLVPKQSSQRIYILDQEDYSKEVQFADSYISTDANQCTLQKTVPEGIGTFNLSLFRHGNLAYRMGVICYTDGGHNEDYIQRSHTDTQSIVYFLPGQSEASCPITIVEDELNELKEHFDVKLKIPVEEYGFTDPLKDSLCVYIDHDIADEPVVSFQQSVITVQESFRRPTTIRFTVSRSGTDLSSETKVQFFLISDNDDLATDGLLNTFHVIPPGANEVIITVTILNSSDSSNKGPENFKIQLFDPFRGKLDKSNPQSSLLEVIILPPEKDIIEFSSDEFVFNETVGLVQVPMYRHGELDYSTTVHCEIELVTLDNEDLLFLSTELVTFGPNDTSGVCNFFSIDDVVREGTEYLRINLTTSDPYVQLQTSTAIVKIVDYEDAVSVGLTVPVKYVREPLSNNPIDVTSVQLKVAVKEDTRVNTTICYTTVNGTAGSGINYQHTEGKLFISSDVKFVEFAVKIFTEQHLSLDKWFTISLHTCNHDNQYTLVPYNSTQVIIMNSYVGEAFFPTLPVVRTLGGDTTINDKGHLTINYTEPLICVTSCDSNHPDYHQSTKDCTKQDINSLSTIYKWEWSKDSVNFHPITQDTLLTKANDKILQPPYFSKGMWLRCHSQAVDSAGIRGYTRTSEPVLLNTSTTRQCGLDQNDTNVESRLSSYDGYQGNPEDLILLNISVPHIHNTFPIISTSKPHDHAHSLLTSSLTQNMYPCSTVSHNYEFLPSGGLADNRHSLISKLFFDRYNSSSCSWTFSMWFTLKSLRNHCSARVSLNGLFVNLSLYIQYVSITENTITNTPLIQERVFFSFEPIAVPVDLPFEYHPINYTEPHPTKLHPIFLSHKSNRTQFIVQSLMSVDGNHGNSIFIEGSYVIRTGGSIVHHGHSHLLKNTIWNETTSFINQTWLVDVTQITSLITDMNLQLSFKSCPLHLYLDQLEDGGHTCMHESETVMYNVPLTLNSSRISVGFSIFGHVRETVGRSEGSCMIEISVSLDPSLVPISPDHRLTLNQVVLCSSDSDDIASLVNTDKDCINTQDITRLLESKVAQGASHLLFYVNRTNTILNLANHKWYVHITMSFQATSSNSITSYKWLPLNTLSGTECPFVSPTDLFSSSNDMPVYATVLISIMLLALVVVITITGLIICYSLSRKYDLKKLELEAAIQEAKCSVIEKERQRLKEQNRQITSYKKRRDERRYQQRCLLLERNQLTVPDNSKDSPDQLPVQQRVNNNNNSDDNSTNKPRPPPGIRLSELSSLYPNNHTNHSLATPPTEHSSSNMFNNRNVGPPPSSYKPTNSIESTAKSLTIRSLPQHTLSTLLRTRGSFNKPQSTTARSSLNKVNNNGSVSTIQPSESSNNHNGCWYDRHLARKKAMNTYVELYLGKTDKEGHVPTLSPETLNKQNEVESNGAAAEKTVAMATTNS